MEGTNQVVTSQAPAPSVQATVPAQAVAASPAINAGMSYQASAPTSQAPAQTQQPLAYQPTAAPQVSAPQGNPWQEAFQALSASLNTSSPSQALGPSYQSQITPTTQAGIQDPWASMQAQPAAQYSQAQTYSPQVSTQTYSAPSNQAQQVASDGYLSQISDASLEVLEHFGAEAPALLNQYACAVEDALIEQVQNGQQQSAQFNLAFGAAQEERNAMNVMLTDPDILADYVNDFYGPNGPYPTPTEQEEAQAFQENARAEFAAEIDQQEMQRQVPANFQRPQMEMPTPGQAAGNPANQFWGNFSQMMDQNPEDAWKYLSQAPAQAIASKMLVQDI